MNKIYYYYKSKNSVFGDIYNIKMYYVLFYYLNSAKIVYNYKYYDYFINKITNIVINNDMLYTDQKVLNYFYIYIKNSFTSFKHFFGYPRFSKTRNNIKSYKNNSIYYKNFLLKYVFKKTFRKYSKKNKPLAMGLEFFNKLYFFHWRYIWSYARMKMCEFLHTSP